MSQTIQDPSFVVDGVSKVALEPEVSERLDKLLASIESHDGVCGNGTMLILGESVLQSRLGLLETRIVRTRMNVNFLMSL